MQIPAAIKAANTGMTGEIDWPSVCAIAHRTRIAPIIYQCLRSTSVPVPGDVMDWFRVQHYDTVARNLASLSELKAILEVFSAAGIPVVVFKGPALAQLGHGMARSWNDLDVLIKSEAIEHVESMLNRAGYHLLAGLPHPYHRRYQAGHDVRHSLLEVHYGINDPVLWYQPDIEAIWDRAAHSNVLGVPARVPELTDHLLLTIMQLPHHHLSVRLLLDIWQVIARWREEIQWEEFFRRAGMWQMTALTRATLFALCVRFGAVLPDSALSRVSPAGYGDRLRTEMLGRAIDEQFEYPFQPKIMWTAPFLMVDHQSRIPRILARRLITGGTVPEGERVARAVHRNVRSLASVPAVVRVLVRSLSHSTGGGG